ncbi:regulator of cell cycle RGCC-like isoform X2 [Dendrobates tinctorius]|uniref:regulator of cell cycle RGCC-like isoform X2 n=1 Tax=Dendrobates tinctorius TaxID=92724 RepID=UPI003CCA08F9
MPHRAAVMEQAVSLDEDLVFTLMEFDHALQDFTRGPCNSEEHLRRLKTEKQTSLNNSDNGSENLMSLKENSLDLSEENLTYSFTNTSHQPKAKLGDTNELENFISDLDKVLNDF